MNKIRRKRLDTVMAQLDEICEELEDIRNEEEEALVNIPENMWGSERASNMQEAVGNIDFAIGSVQEASEYIESVINE